ncbi:MAG: dockerin type I domain-containing protein [Gemmatimonadetes bacterium]|nr:dockerin type I domain-containing protein [Gemmatimonadota bacterium]
MSRLNSHRVLTVLVLVFIGWGQADARPARVSQLPNGSALGCASCHVNPGGGGTLTSFGRDINNNYLTQPGRSGQVVWNAMLAMLDSDGDGVSNGQELGDPDGDGTVDASIQVTNPGDSNSFVPQQPATPAVTSFAIGGVTLQEDVKNPPVPSGMQQFEITFNVPIKIENVGAISYPAGLFVAMPAISEDHMKLTGSVNLSEGTTYQILIGNPDANLSEAQQYFLGTVELSDAVVSGVGILPEGFTPGPGGAFLIDSELYSKALMDGTDPFESAIVRISNFNVLESFPEQLAFEFPHVTDGSYVLSLNQEVMDAQGNTVQLGAFVGINPFTGEVDPASLIQVVDGASVTGLQVMLEEITEPELFDIRDVSVQSVNAETNSFFIQRNGQQISVDASQALMITLDLKNFEDIVARFFSGNVEDLAQLIFPISDLMPGDTVSILGLPISGTAIQALIVIRQAPAQTRSADLDGDGDVDFSDFLLFAAAFGTSEGGPGYNAAADLDGDGTVAFSDFLIFANAFGKPVSGG